MNSSIKNPFRHTKRSLERSTRRDRPNYPAIGETGQMLVDRNECGETRYRPPVDRKTWISPTLTLLRKFVFKRGINAPSRSKYIPHFGYKQSVKIIPFSKAH